jgi:8-oxo-dGTP diphosphatase
MKNYKYCPFCKSRLIRKNVEGNSRSVCEACGWILYSNPLPSVAALMRNDNNEILLIKRGVVPSKGRWALPTGFIEQGELPEHAVLRELREETNIKGSLKRLIGVYLEHTTMYGSIILIGYEINYSGGTPKPGSDTTEAAFFPADQLPSISFASHRAIIRESNNNHTQPLVEILKSKITEATITHTQLYYQGSMGIDAKIMKAAQLLPGEKVQVLNYSNGNRLETYTIAEKSGSGRIVLYGPASLKGTIGDRLCILSYGLASQEHAKNFKPRIVILDKRNKIK